MFCPWNKVDPASKVYPSKTQASSHYIIFNLQITVQIIYEWEVHPDCPIRGFIAFSLHASVMPSTGYYSSHCNINIHLLLYPPYYTGSQLRMESMAYTFCSTNSKPRASIWQKIFHQKQQKQYIILPSQKPCQVFYNLGKLMFQVAVTV